MTDATKLFIILFILVGSCTWNEGALFVTVDSSDIRNGDTIKLICNGSTETSCCTGIRQWDVGLNNVMYNGSSDKTKYEETVGQDTFTLLIKSSNKSDFAVDYTCRHRFTASSGFTLLPFDFFSYVPGPNEIQVWSNVDNRTLSIDANLTTVYPEPNCTANFGESKLTVTTSDNYPFKSARISMTDDGYQCGALLKVECAVNSYSFNVLTLTVPCSSPTDCKYSVCILIGVTINIVFNGIITILLIKKIPGDEPDNRNKGERFAASVVILILGSIEMYIITIIISACYEVCSCNKTATIGYSVIPVLLVPLAYSIVILISHVRRNRPSKTNIIWALHVLSFGISICIQYIRTKMDEVKVKPIKDKYNEVIITTEGYPPKRLLSCNLQNTTSGKTKSFYIHYKRINEKNYRKTITPQINAFELDKILDDNESYEIYITEIGTQWKSLIFTCETMKDKHAAQSVDLERDCTLLKKLHSNKHICDVNWTHNGKPILTENSNIYKGGNIDHPSLTILSASDADSGKYVCTVTFRHDHEREMERVTEVKQYWIDLTVCAEKEAKTIDLLRECTLLEKLHGNKHITDVQWIHNGKKILTENSCIYKGGDTNHPALTILLASNTDSGKYLCTITFKNETGKTEVKEYHVELTICDTKEAKSIYLLDECTLLEKLHSNKYITDVQWTHNGHPILTENSCVYKGGNKNHPAITILYASNDDAGKYLCTVTFGNSEIKEYHVDLAVSDKKEAKSIDLLQDCTLLEKLHSNRHITGVHWTHAVKPILTVNSSFYKGGDASHPALTILYASNADSGEYVCTVTFTNEQKITEIKEYHVDLAVNDTKAVKLLQECTLLEQLHSSDHIKSVYWTHKGHPIQTEISDIYKGGVASHPALTLLYMSNTDFGEYVCTVTFDGKNKAEEIKTFIVNLTVAGSLELEKLVKPGKNIQLLKKVKGFINLKSVQWLHNKQKIDIENNCLYVGGNTNSPALTILYASEDDSGKYVCTLVFHHQSVESHPGITKQFVTHLKVEPIAERAVTEGKEVTLIKTLKRNSKDESMNSVVWMHNSKQIDVNDSTYYGGDTADPPLTIVSACLADSGNYLCTLTFHNKADDQSQRVEKRQFAVSLKVNEKKSPKQRALPPLKTEEIEK